MPTVTGTEAGDNHPGNPATALFLHQSLGKAGRWISKADLLCYSITYTLLGQRMGGILVSTVYFSALHSILNKQTYWEEFFFSVKKTFTKLKGNQNSNLKNENKTMQ